MKYISIDIETTGLDPFVNQILEIGAIFEDTNNILPREQCPQFHVYIDYKHYVCDAYAAALNVDIFKKIVQLRKENNTDLLVKPERVSSLFSKFLITNGITDKVIPAGKNFGSFDLQFLNQLPNFNNIKIHHRQLDPTIIFVNFETDQVLPDLSACKKLAGLPEQVTHQALDDAWDVIQLLRTKYVK